MNETDLTLEVIDKGEILTSFSARECTQTLSLLPQGVLRRTINGNLVYVGHLGHRKFESLISCKDKSSPALSGVWKGTRLKVGCIQFLTQTIPQGSEIVELDRIPVSLHVFDKEGKLWPVIRTEDKVISLKSSFPGGYISYRPSLMMIVRNYHLETNEWGLSVGWSLDLEEE